MICGPLVSKGSLCQQSEEVHQTLLTVRGDAAVTQQTSGELNTLDERISTMTLWTLASMESASGWTYVDIRAAVPDYKTDNIFYDGRKKKYILAVNWEEENVVWD